MNMFIELSRKPFVNYRVNVYDFQKTKDHVLGFTFPTSPS
jgi:hypothetical protein